MVEEHDLEEPNKFYADQDPKADAGIKKINKGSSQFGGILFDFFEILMLISSRYKKFFKNYFSLGDRAFFKIFINSLKEIQQSQFEKKSYMFLQ